MKEERSDEELAEALWNLQHEKSELHEQEARLTREIARRAEKDRLEAGVFRVMVTHRAYALRDLPDKFYGDEAA